MLFLKLDMAMIWELAKAVVPIIISMAALGFVLKDRSAKLDLRDKPGDWYKLKMTLNRPEVLMQGVIEIYNRSSRANAIRRYSFEYKDLEGNWRAMESEQYTNTESHDDKKTDEVFNRTGLTIAPFSAVECTVQARAKMPRPKDGLQVRIWIEDLFAKNYDLTVTATF